MSGVLMVLAVMVGTMVAGTLAVFGVIYLVKLLKLIFRLIAHVFGCLGGVVADTFRFLGALVVALIFVPLVASNIVIGRWSAASHFGRALWGELTTATLCLYRVCLGHWVTLLGLRGLTEGIERRLPRAIADAPGRDRPGRATGMFEGYEVVASLPGGGSGGKLYIARPNDLKQASFVRRGHADVDRVVIKSFSLSDGSSLPQIVRESRALDAARKLGLVLEHDLRPERFFYVMRYVPGDNLAAVTQRLHAQSRPHTPPGLDAERLREGLGYVRDLLETLSTYHDGGLWHKDVKPENIIIDERVGRAHLVDFGLITPLRSAMTLTTHGTEYYRDPEMVRQALKGVKVHQIDGARFDVFAAGAVMYALVEGSFPAHGVLSQVSRRCPESVKWIVRRAMTDYDKRYPSAAAMLADVRAVLTAADPFVLRPADLPSVRGLNDAGPAEPAHGAPRASEDEAAPAAIGGAAAASRDAAQRLEVRDWWTGRYAVHAGSPVPAPAAAAARPLRHASVMPRGERAPAAEQVRRARERAAAKRAGTARSSRAAASILAHRAARRSAGSRKHDGVNIGVLLVVFLVVGAVGGLVAREFVGGTAPRPSVVVAEATTRDRAVIDRKTTADAAGVGRDAVLVAASAPLAGDAAELADAAAAALARAGWRVFAERDAFELGEGVLPSLRAAHGVLPDDDALFASGVRGLIATSARLAGVVWIEPDSEEPASSQVLLIDRDGWGVTGLDDADEGSLAWFGHRADAAPNGATPRVLMLSDVRAPLDEATAALVREAVAALRSRGAEVGGELLESPAGDDAAERQAQAIAALRVARSSGLLGDPAVLAALRDAVARDEGTDGAVWIARGDRDGWLLVACVSGRGLAAAELGPGAGGAKVVSLLDDAGLWDAASSPAVVAD